MRLSAPHWLALQGLATVALASVLLIGLAGISFQLLDLPWFTWLLTSSGLAFLADGRRIKALAREQVKD